MSWINHWPIIYQTAHVLTGFHPSWTPAAGNQLCTQGPILVDSYGVSDEPLLLNPHYEFGLTLELLLAWVFCEVGKLGPPLVPFYPFLEEGSPTKIDYRNKGYPYSNLSTGGLSKCLIAYVIRPP